MVTGRLGEGGQGAVFLGRDPDGKVVAIKMLHARLAGDGAARTRFLREAEAARQVARFCTAQVIAADVAGDRPYIVSEYVQGRSLHELVKQEGARSGADLERLAISTATALTAIHKAGIVHRDLKPNNVLIGPDGPRVIDFGVARIDGGPVSGDTGAFGTPAFMAPEQFVKEGHIGPAADVFAWGATMVFAATGQPPFSADSIPATMHRIMHDQADLGALEQPLHDLVSAALAKDPQHRPTARDVLDRLLGADAPAPSAVSSALGTPAGGAGASMHRFAVGEASEQPTGQAAERAGGHDTTPPGYVATADLHRRRGLLIAGSTVLGALMVAAIVLAIVLTGPDRDAESSASSTQGAVPATSPGSGTAPSGSATSPGPANATLPGQSRSTTTTRPTRRPATPPPASGSTGPTVLGKPDTAHACTPTRTGPTSSTGPKPGGGSTAAYYEDGEWRCPSSGIVPYDTITMTGVCKNQYGSAAYARYNGGGEGNASNYDCVKD
jgi:serine/threonine protein kinase